MADSDDDDHSSTSSVVTDDTDTVRESDFYDRHFYDGVHGFPHCNDFQELGHALENEWVLIDREFDPSKRFRHPRWYPRDRVTNDSVVLVRGLS